MALDKPLEHIEESDLQALIDNGVREDKTIDYKLHVGGSDSDKKEFLKDVSSFANASGGHLVVGLAEDPPGVPKGPIEGVLVADVDGEIQRLENLLRDSIEPRLFGVSMRPVPLRDASTAAVVIRVRKSLAAPHMVRFKTHWRFYSRNSSGAYPLDVGEIRAAFALSETTAERLRGFRVERLAVITADETPAYVNGSSRVVLHVVPLAALDPAHRFDATTLRAYADRHVLPLRLGASGMRYNFDGYLMPAGGAGSGEPPGYLQIFHSGVLEAVDASMFLGERQTIDAGVLGPSLIEVLRDYLAFQDNLGIEPPIYVMVSMLEVRRYALVVRESFSAEGGRRFDRDSLVIPEVVVEAYDMDPARILRPVFDAIWNAAGFERCLDYDANGTYWYTS